jgi:hypothetical protein
MIAVGDAVWNAVIGGVVTIVLALLARTNNKLNAIAKVGEKTHMLVNSSMGAQLTIAAVALKRLAASGDPDDIAASELADKLLREHEARQASVDAKEKQ